MLLKSLFKHWSYRVFAPGTILREKYEAFKQLLQFDINCHEQMANLQELQRTEKRQDLSYLRERTSQLSQNVAGMIDSLEMMSPGSFTSLRGYHKKFDFYIRFLLAPPKIVYEAPHVISLSEISRDNQNIGGKAKNLATLCNHAGIRTPNGFAVTTGGYHLFVEQNNLRSPIDHLLSELDVSSPSSLTKISKELKNLILSSTVPPELENSVNTALVKLQTPNSKPSFAVRSNAVFEDSNITFAGQYNSLLHVESDNICDAYREILASKYSPEALYYRINHGLGDEETAMSVLVQEMVEARCSGVIYTSEPTLTKPQTDHLHIYASPGTCDTLVSGKIIPNKITLSRDHSFPEVSTPSDNVLLSSAELQNLARQAMIIEEYFGVAQDIEWAISHGGDTFILQARELQRSDPSLTDLSIQLPVSDEEILLRDCDPASPGVAGGEVFILSPSESLDGVPTDAVLVTRDSMPEYVMLLERVSAVVTEHGSRASHFATVAREFGVPFVAGAQKASANLVDGTPVTVDGNRGIVYKGLCNELLTAHKRQPLDNTFNRTVSEAMKFITPLELVDPQAKNFTPEGCRSMHDIIRLCHEKALLSMFTTDRPGSGRGSVKLHGNIPLDVFLFDVGDAIERHTDTSKPVRIEDIHSAPFQALWRGLSHPDVQWKQKPFDWEAYDKVMLSGGVPPKQESFSFASYSVVSRDYLHFNIRFGYHFAILDVFCGENSIKNHCMLRFAGGGGDFENRSRRIDFIKGVLEQLQFAVDKKGDLLEAKLGSRKCEEMEEHLDMLGRLLGATKLMDMILQDDAMVSRCIDDFFAGRYSFSEQG